MAVICSLHAKEITGILSRNKGGNTMREYENMRYELDWADGDSDQYDYDFLWENW